LSKTYKTEGIIFKSLKYSETSLILDIYTSEIGLQSFIVSGVRKSKTKSSNIYQAMNIVELIAYRSENSLSRIKEANLAEHFNGINKHVVLSAMGMFMIDLARSVIKQKETDKKLYAFLRTQLINLDNQPDNISILPTTFAIELASYLGFEITNNYTQEDKYFDLHSGQFIENNVNNSLILPDTLSLLLHKVLKGEKLENTSKMERNLILDKILKYYELHLDGFKPLKSLPVLRTILS